MTKMNTPHRIRKGDRVYLFCNWDRKGTCAWYGYVVDSAGTQQIHLRTDDGEMLKRRIYVDSGNDLRLQSEVADPVAAALAYGESYRLAQIEHLKSCLERYADGDRFYLQGLRQQLTEVEATASKQVYRRL